MVGEPKKPLVHPSYVHACAIPYSDSDSSPLSSNRDNFNCCSHRMYDGMALQKVIKLATTQSPASDTFSYMIGASSGLDGAKVQRCRTSTTSISSEQGGLASSRVGTGK